MHELAGICINCTYIMERTGKFKIIDSFKITNRGLVAIGDIIEGSVKVGDYLRFHTTSNYVLLKIAGGDIADRISTREAFVGLSFVHTTKEHKQRFEHLKLQEQVVDIWDGTDWRLNSQENYLFGVELFHINYGERKTATDHDHCAFCGAKFSNTIPGQITKGYSNADHYHWICESCFEDFREAFNWKTD